MALLVRAFPLVLPPSELDDVITELTTRRDQERRKFYAAHGVTHESWYLQPMGPVNLVIGLTQVTDCDTASQAFARSEEPFALWFKQQIQRMSGVDASQMPEGPPTTLVYEWSESEHTRMQFAPPR